MSGLLDKAKEAETSKVAVNEAVKVTSDVSEVVVSSSTEAASSVFGNMLSDGMGLKIGAALVSLLVLFVGYQVAMGFSFGQGSIAITDHSIEEDNDALKIQIRFGNPMFSSASKDVVQISVSYGDEEVYTTTATPSSNLMNVEIKFSDFYQGNSRAMGSSGSDIFYKINANQGDLKAVEYNIEPASMMDRTITKGDGELIVMSTNSNTECNGVCHDGVSMRVSMGVQDAVNADLISHIDSDYKINADIIYEGSQVVYSYPQITVNGFLAQWSTSGQNLLSGAGSVEDGWLQLSGSDSGNFGIEYIARDDFYQDDGCYLLRFTLDMDSTYDVNNVGTLTFESPGYDLHWNANEGANDGDNYQPTGEC
ncbi:MAG: hypothetical protein CMB64_05420 [Euryarchaeota archaeon]|nr:hypothetical protein [Euryarchaeota archaeon]